ncbi:MAG: antibiotic biosynthesis monooxygenase [Candidatus Aureabacteria bacterium]|nr:antibiotic biosynthesis monooxygenase [Candidatus Auribacterota bacterium]
MLIVQVSIRVKPERVEDFKTATLDNARNSLREAGIMRFDVLQQQDDPTRFILIEAFRTPEAPAAHKDTAHYQRWRDRAEEMLAEPRKSVKFVNVHPDDSGWR